MHRELLLVTEGKFSITTEGLHGGRGRSLSVSTPQTSSKPKRKSKKKKRPLTLSRIMGRRIMLSDSLATQTTHNPLLSRPPTMLVTASSHSLDIADILLHPSSRGTPPVRTQSLGGTEINTVPKPGSRIARGSMIIESPLGITTMNDTQKSLQKVSIAHPSSLPFKHIYLPVRSRCQQHSLMY